MPIFGVTAAKSLRSFSRRGHYGLCEKCGLVRSALVLSEHLSRLAELAERYADRKPDLADLCLIRLSELHPRYPVITTDLSDFRVYRRGRREVIPLIHRPER